MTDQTAASDVKAAAFYGTGSLRMISDGLN